MEFFLEASAKCKIFVHIACMTFSRLQAVHPCPIDEEEEAKKNDDLGDEYFCLNVTPFRGHEERDGKKEEVAQVDRHVVFFYSFLLLHGGAHSKEFQDDWDCGSHSGWPRGL